jgi:hypothetical protein
MKKYLTSRVLGLAVVSIASIAYRAYVPIYPLYGAKNDDNLMVVLGNNILKDDWLGNYNDLGHLTLSKGPGFPIFLARTHFLPWNPIISVHMLLLFGALLVIHQLALIFRCKSWMVPAFALIAFFPAWYGGQMSRIYRDGLLAALIFVLIGLSLVLLRHLSATDHQPLDSVLMLPLGLLVGFLVSFHHITRNIPIGILAQFGLILVFAMFRVRSLRVFKQCTLFLLSGLLGYLPLVGYVKDMNEKRYGVAEIDSYYSGAFSDALRLMASVNGGSDMKFVAVTGGMRSEMYKVSPTLAKLGPNLEVPAGTGWSSQSCRAINVCDESAAWFPWELRDAVESAGLARTATEFERTFQSIRDELKDACKRKQITCGSPAIAPGLSSISKISYREVFESTFIALDQLLKIEPGQQNEPPYLTELSGKIYRTWDETINGLPLNEKPTSHKPGQSTGTYSLEYLRKVYSTPWNLAIGISTFAMAVGLGFKKKNYRNTLFVIAPVLAGFLLNLSILTIIEADTGLYLTGGGAMYLLSIYPYQLTLVLAILMGLVQSLAQVRKASSNVEHTFQLSP